MFSCSVCTVRDPSTDTISIAPASIEKQDFDVKDPWRESREEAEAEAVRAVEEQARKEMLAAQAWMRTSIGLEAAWARAGVEEWKRGKELEAAAKEEADAQEAVSRESDTAAEEALREAQAAAEASEKVCREKERDEEARRHAEAQRQADEDASRKTEERQKLVAAFLQKHGYASVTRGKRTLLKTTYALHEAAKRGDAEMAMMLIEEGADMAQKNSRGHTALQRAQQQDQGGSHADVIRVLGGGVMARRGGA